MTLSRHFSLSFIASGWSSGLHPVSPLSCCTYVRAGRPAFVRSYEGVHRSTSLMSSSLLLQQCPACLVRLTWIVFVKGGKWPYSWCFVGCCLHDLFNIARSYFTATSAFLSFGRNNSNIIDDSEQNEEVNTEICNYLLNFYDNKCECINTNEVIKRLKMLKF